MNGDHHPNEQSGPSLDRDMALLSAARQALSKVFVGQGETVDQLLVCLFASGHALIEGAPGLGKTLLVRTMADVGGLKFSRIQFTPDLMPADITGTMVLAHDESGKPSTRFQAGPLFGQLVLADEINRATPKTQSALLEAMQEKTVTVAGNEYPMQKPFHVFATQNPFEMEGTYSLPEAQIDRFLFKVIIDYPSERVLEEILDQTTGAHVPQAEKVLTPADILRIQHLVREVPMAEHVRKTIVRFVRATLPQLSENEPAIRRYVRFGISPRGAQAVVLAAKSRALLSGRYNVSLDDVRASVLPALRHRFQLNFEGMAEGVSAEQLLLETFERHARSVASV